MPFKKFPHSSLPLTTVDVRFKGLLVINPADNSKECEIGIHRMGDDHFPLIEIRGRTPQGLISIVGMLLTLSLST